MTATHDPGDRPRARGSDRPPAGARAQRRLPAAVHVLVLLLLVKAALIVAILLGASYAPLRLIADTTVTYRLIAPLIDNPVVLAVISLVAVALAFAAIALLRRRRIGWLLAMVLTGAFVALDIYAFLTAGANHLWMAVNIVTVFYLNQADVREAVGAGGDGPDLVEPAPLAGTP